MSSPIASDTEMREVVGKPKIKDAKKKKSEPANEMEDQGKKKSTKKPQITESDSDMNGGEENEETVGSPKKTKGNELVSKEVKNRTIGRPRKSLNGFGAKPRVVTVSSRPRRSSAVNKYFTIKIRPKVTNGGMRGRPRIHPRVEKTNHIRGRPRIHPKVEKKYQSRGRPRKSAEISDLNKDNSSDGEHANSVHSNDSNI